MIISSLFVFCCLLCSCVVYLPSWAPPTWSYTLISLWSLIALSPVLCLPDVSSLKYIYVLRLWLSPDSNLSGYNMIAARLVSLVVASLNNHQSVYGWLSCCFLVSYLLITYRYRATLPCLCVSRFALYLIACTNAVPQSAGSEYLKKPYSQISVLHLCSLCIYLGDSSMITSHL
jgi:hypothetical protein